MIFDALKLKIAAGVAVAAVTVSFWTGWEWRDRAADSELLRKDAEIAALHLLAQQSATAASEQARQLEHLTQERLALANEADALRSQERAVVERIITNEVIRYVQNPDNGRLVMPGDWVRIHDIAAIGRNAGVPEAAFATGSAYAAAARITDAGAIAVTTQNYSTCHAIRDQLISLQEWVAAL